MPSIHDFIYTEIVDLTMNLVTKAYTQYEIYYHYSFSGDDLSFGNAIHNIHKNELQVCPKIRTITLNTI